MFGHVPTIIAEWTARTRHFMRLVVDKCEATSIGITISTTIWSPQADPLRIMLWCGLCWAYADVDVRILRIRVVVGTKTTLQINSKDGASRTLVRLERPKSLDAALSTCLTEHPLYSHFLYCTGFLALKWLHCTSHFYMWDAHQGIALYGFAPSTVRAMC